MPVEILIWSPPDHAKLAKCSVCGAEWTRPKGRAGRAALLAFAQDHDRRHKPAHLFDPDRPS